MKKFFNAVKEEFYFDQLVLYAGIGFSIFMLTMSLFFLFASSYLIITQ